MLSPIAYLFFLPRMLAMQACTDETTLLDQTNLLQYSRVVAPPVVPSKVKRSFSLLQERARVRQSKRHVNWAKTSKRADASVSSAVNIWPMPKTIDHGMELATISSKLIFEGDVDSPHVAQMIQRYRDLLFPHADHAEGNIKRASVVLGKGTSEKYTLVVKSSGIEIHADAPVGVQYALETLSQLVAFDFDKEAYVTQPVLPLTIKDEPRYQHRGLLIDSSRHFLSVRAIKRLIRSISYAKLNRLHWHITDAQSFPISSRVEPSLPKLGAWSRRERYTRDDVKEIVEFAKDHSIMVVPEFDMPGHSASWGKAHPEVMALTADRYNDGNTGALNPKKDETLKLVRSLLQDWVSPSAINGSFFDGSLVHLGTDEVPYTAWRGLGNSNELFTGFVKKVTQMAQDLGKGVVLWEEAVKDAFPERDAIIQVWLDTKMVKRATDRGHRVILSEGWYLDHLDDTWEAMYQKDPASLVQQDKAQLMLGGEGCMWGETVDGGDLEQTVWPRLGAIAERLWSSNGGNVQEARPRLESFRCTLLERGIPSGTLEGRGRSTPNGPGSCSSQ